MKDHRILYLFPWLILRKYRFKYGFDIPARTKIGLGFYLNHTGGVVISSEAELGNNVNISHGVTIGYSPRGRMKGYPKIGDNVFIGPGAKIFGNVAIGDNACIGANTVVLVSIPNNSCVYGCPVKIIPGNDNEFLIINKFNT